MYLRLIDQIITAAHGQAAAGTNNKSEKTEFELGAANSNFKLQVQSSSSGELLNSYGRFGIWVRGRKLEL